MDLIAVYRILFCPSTKQLKKENGGWKDERNKQKRKRKRDRKKKR
jgi:hypothetical protein